MVGCTSFHLSDIKQDCSTSSVSPDEQKEKRLLNFKKGGRKRGRECLLFSFISARLSFQYCLFVRPDKMTTYRIKELVKIVTNTLCNVIICVLIHHSLHYLARFGDP